ncbi:MAG: NADP-dependent oxidoreductase [Steroidobacteraceae bacterium]
MGACIGVAVAATPKEQKAIVQNGNGGPEVLKLQTIPVLEPGDGQVLVKVYAAAVNPVDWKMRAGMTGRGGPPGGGAGGAPGGGGAGGPPGGGAPGGAGGGAGGPPGGGAPGGGGAGGPPGGGGGGGSSTSVPGMDVAGVVEKVGPGVTTFKVGDPVFSMIGRGKVTGLNGGYSEYVVAPVANVVAKPKNLTYAQAAGIGTAGMTGERAVDQAGVAKGQKVLILGIAGGVGSSAAQIAKARGATVVGTASAQHNAYLKSIGVDQVIDYTKGNFEDQVKDVDVVINTVTGTDAERSLKTLKKGGKLVSVAGGVAADKCTAAGVNCIGGGPGGAAGPSEGDMLAAVAKLASEGKFTVKVDKTFALDKAGDAQVLGAQNHTEGKIILTVAPEASKK